MATTFLEPGGDSDFGIGLWPTAANGTPAAVTDIVHGGHINSIRYRPANNEYVNNNGCLTDAGGRVSFWLYIVALPNATSTFFSYSDFTANDILKIRLTSTGVLQLFAGVNQIGSNGATLSTGQWYRISFAYVITSSTVNDAVVFVNGASTITTHNVSLPATGGLGIRLGNYSNNATFDLRSSDHYVDNSTSLTDPGNIWVTAKRPNANGTSNQFTTQIGAGGSGYGTGHSPQVNERPNSDADGWSISTTTTQTEEYNIESAATGDINIASATIVDYMGWIRADVDSTANSPVHHIIVNGVSTAKTMTISPAFYEQIAGSSTYPSGTGTDIGMDAQFTTTPHVTSLFECGIVVAYIPSPNTGGSSRLLMGIGT